MNSAKVIWRKLSWIHLEIHEQCQFEFFLNVFTELMEFSERKHLQIQLPQNQQDKGKIHEV